ncbi:large ribosomal subunit protein bL9m-like isoform X2 [Haliotis cracherodii]|uniref:large ribosomal subunit protein bL9m-like isoform X2 n=1 Tax=Haliotis cracherodii TaxID=6455 RepID=UPI0039EA23DE
MLRSSLQAVKELGQLLRSAVRGAPCLNVDQTRSTVVVERVYPTPLGKVGQMPPLKNKHRVYRLRERVHSKPTPPIKCILLEDIKGVGVKGSVISVDRGLFRNKLYPTKATYASPENLAELGDERVDETRATPTARQTLEQLSWLHLRIPMNGERPWTLNKTNVKVALRKMGVEVEESCLTMPTETITEPQEISISITVNKMETVHVKGTVFHIHKDTSEDFPPTFPPVWSKPKEAGDS